MSESSEEMLARWRQAIVDAGAQTVEQMRDTEAPWPETVEELAEYVRSLVERPHDYGTRVYAMSLAATAAFNLVAIALDATGLQASCADLDFLRRVRLIDGPFLLVTLEQALYPRSHPQQRLDEWLVSDSSRAWLADQAWRKLRETDGGRYCMPDVAAHWEALAKHARGD